MILTTETLARFWAKVDKRSDDECWDWMASKNSSGYGTFWANKKVTAAHRLSYQIAKGEIPSGMNVLHRCDRPCCVNPAHLWAGTQAENVQDMTRKQRHGQAKLTEDQVREIYRLSEEGLLDREIADRFGVAHTTIVMILNGKTWGHLREKPAKRKHFLHRLPDKRPVGEKNGYAKLTEDKVRQIRQIKQSSGLSNKRIGEMFGVSSSRVSDICSGRSWKHVQ